MTDQFGFNPDDQFGQPNTNDNKGLRSWAESQAKENKELKEQMASIQQELNRQKAVNTFEDLGLPRSAAALYQGDITPDAVKAWADSVRSVFGVQTSNAGQSAPPAPPVLDGQAQQSYQDFTQAGQNGQPSTSIDDAQRSVNQAGSVADLINAAKSWR